jgi:molybdopterin-biosynthesis enzyme MoeA-like protein
MPESNRKQAMLPKGSPRLDNEWGTAPGFALKSGQCQFAFVPGVPSEMKQMFRGKITPLVLTPFKTQPWKLMTIKTIGMGESDIQACLDALIFPEAVQLGFRAGSGEVQTKLLFPPDFPEAEINNFTHEVAKQIGDPVFAIDGQGKQKRSIASVLGEVLHKQQRTLSILETISQGLMAAKCIEIDSLSESMFANSTEQICTKFNIDAQDDLLATASEIAKAYRTECRTDYALVQLYNREAIDPTNQKQSIQLYVALATSTETITQHNRVRGTIKRKQNQAALLGLDFLRRYLQNNIKGS